MNKKLLFLPLLIIGLILSGCTPDPVNSSESSNSIDPSQSSTASESANTSALTSESSSENNSAVSSESASENNSQSSAASESESLSQPSSESESENSVATSSESLSENTSPTTEASDSSETSVPEVWENQFPLTVSGWPTQIIDKYLESFGIDIEVPVLELTSDIYLELLDDDYYYSGFKYLSLFLENEDVLTPFNNLLSEAGFNIQDDFENENFYQAYDASWGELMIDAYYSDVENNEGTYIRIIALVEYVAVLPPTNPDKNAVFSFSDESQILGEKAANETTWGADLSTFVVEKNGSNHGVGNPGPEKDFYSNPLRLYTSQTVTINAGGDNLIEQVKFKVENYDVAEKDSIGTLADAIPENATYYVIGDSITFVFAEPVANFSFQIDPYASVQVRLFSVTLYFI